jgi:DNA-binding MarR family transcriptional regulator
LKTVTESGPKDKNQRHNLLDDVATDLATIPGHLHRVIRTRAVRRSLRGKSGEVTPLHHEILHLLEENGKVNPAEIGRRLQVAKAQITKLINKLVELGLIERKTNTADKRVYNVSLTQNGKRFTRQQRKAFNGAVDVLTKAFSDEDLKELSVSLRKIHEILRRME